MFQEPISLAMPRLTFCTLTGVDESTPIDALIALAEAHPIVEWGILYSPSRQGQSGRYPSYEAIQRILDGLPAGARQRLAARETGPHQLALHVQMRGAQQQMPGQQRAGLPDTPGAGAALGVDRRVVCHALTVLGAARAVRAKDASPAGCFLDHLARPGRTRKKGELHT